MTFHSKKVPCCMLLPLHSLCMLLVLLSAITAQGATYYVSTTGSDANPGTSASPWRNPQKCAASPIKAGDTCLVQSGTYTDPNGKGVVLYVNSNSAAGTASLPITIKSENPLGAVIIVPSTSGANRGVFVSRPYYIIEGFDISGGTNNGASVSYDGIYFASTATGSIARSNSIHHIGRSLCTNSTYGFDGIATSSVSSVIIERNRIYSIGRRRNGESGCSTTRFQNDHGLYLRGTSNVTVRRNVIYDTNRGYPIHIYSGTTTNLNIYHNTLSGGSPTGSPLGQIMLASTINTATIRNNTSYGAVGGMITTYALSGSNLTASYNLSNTLMPASYKVSGITFSNNFERTNPAFVSSSTNDFRLTSSSPAINRGTASGIPLVPDGVPDIGGYEYATQNTTSSPLTPTRLRTL